MTGPEIAVTATVYATYTIGLGIFQARENRVGSDPKYHAEVWWVMLVWPMLLVWVLTERAWAWLTNSKTGGRG